MRDEYQRGQQTVIEWIPEGVGVIIILVLLSTHPSHLDAIYGNTPATTRLQSYPSPPSSKISSYSPHPAAQLHRPNAPIRPCQIYPSIPSSLPSAALSRLSDSPSNTSRTLPTRRGSAHAVTEDGLSV